MEEPNNVTTTKESSHSASGDVLGEKKTCHKVTEMSSEPDDIGNASNKKKMKSSGKFDVGCDQESLLKTPYTNGYIDTFVASMKEDSSSYSSSSWDIEDNFDSLFDSTNIVGEGLPELKEDYFDLEHQNEYGSYDELPKKFTEKEEELRVSNYKLEHLEEEVIKLKNQIEQSKGQLDDVQKELKEKESYLKQCEGELDGVQKELKLKEDDLEYEIGQVLDMQKQKAEQAILVQDYYCYKITKLEEQLEVVNEKLKVSSNEIERLTKELGRKLHETDELQGQLKVAAKRVAKLECECDLKRKQIQDIEEKVKWYKANENKMVDAWAVALYMEKGELHSDVGVKEWEKRSNAFENKLRKCEAANLELKELHDAQQKALNSEINSLKKEVGQRKNDVKAMKKKYNRQKQKFFEVLFWQIFFVLVGIVYLVSMKM